MARDIIVLIDGTTRTAAKGFRKYFTNAFRPARGIAKDKSRDTVFLYFPGPASRPLPLHWLNIASGIEVKAILLEAYLNVCLNVNNPKEDRLFLFGYSRGGAVAKALASMIDKSGMLGHSHIQLLKHAWSYYHYGWETSKASLGQHPFKMKIEFVGIFDAVLGPKAPWLEFRVDRQLPECVLHGVEIVSHDERRWEFAPNLWAHPSTPTTNINVAPSFARQVASRFQQIWMPGGHGDIGDPQGDGYISDLAFLTMMERLESLTSAPIDFAYIARIFADTLSSTRRIQIHSSERILGNRRRLILEKGVAEIHPLLNWMSGRLIRDGKRVIEYGHHNNVLEAVSSYELMLRNIVKSSAQPEADLRNAVEDLLTQVD